MQNYINIVKEIVLKRVPLDDYAVFLFGSRAVGNNHSMSDIDIGVWGDKPLSVIIKLDLEEKLQESIVPFKIDLIDFFEVSKEFKHYALEKIDVWNLNKNSTLSYPI
jgi:predicted nucleotidyltransferase